MKKQYEKPIIEFIEVDDIIVMSTFGEDVPGTEDEDN